MVNLSVGQLIALVGASLLLGGGGLRVIDLLIAWVRERREQKRDASAHEKDRPRFRIDVTVLENPSPMRKTIRVKVISLGSLPVTVNYGDVTVYSSQYPEPVISQQFSRKEVTPAYPIEIEFSMKHGVLHPSGVGDFEVKLICKFSYGEDGQSQAEEQFYNRQTRQFENRECLRSS